MKYELSYLLKKFNKLKKLNKIKVLELHSPYFKKSDLIHINNCIKSTFVSTKGNYIEKFVKKIKKVTKSKYVILTNTGSSATYLALRSINIKKDTEILIPTLNYISNINAILALGAIPHFVDSEVQTLGIDLIKMEKYFNLKFKKLGSKYVNRETKKTLSGIICTHIFGNTSNIDKLRIFCKKKKIFLIEDSSEALGSKYKKKSLGTFGDIGLLSFNGNKIITSGGGGAMLTNNKKIYLKAKHLSQNAKIEHNWKYDYNDLGYNIGMPNLNASLGFSQIIRLNQNIDTKKKLYKYYEKYFSDLKYFRLLKINRNLKSNYWLITLLINKNSFRERNKIIEFLNQNKIKARPIWQLLHKIKDYSKFQSMNLKNAKSLEKRIINIPSSAHLRTLN